MVCLFFRSSASLPHACYTGQQIETATSAKHHFNNLNTRNGLLQTKLHCTHHCVFNLLYALLARFICTVGELPGKAWRSAWARWALSNSVAETPSGLLHVHMKNVRINQIPPLSITSSMVIVLYGRQLYWCSGKLSHLFWMVALQSIWF